MKHIIPILLFSFLISAQCFAAKEPMKYGKPEQSELDMKVYSPDSSAAAVVLCNYGYFSASDFQFVHQMRIKILKESGKSYGDFVVPAAEKTNVKGVVFNVENGKVVQTKLGKDGIFVERITRDNYRVRVAMPNVKVGSVLDVEFFFQGIPAYWEFQKNIPVRWSELILEPATEISLRKNITGYVPFKYSGDDRWVTSDVPAFKTELYMNNYENFLGRMILELESIHIPGVYYKDYATTWNAVASYLQSHEDFGMLLASFNLFLNDASRDIKKASDDQLIRMEDAFKTIKKMKWNKSESIWPSENGIAYAFNKKTGNSADINMCLIALLRKLDIEAYPVLLSTRENGMLPPFSVSLDKLNYMVVKAVVNDSTYLMDATEENMPVNLLPERCLNERGLCIHKNNFEWINLTPKQRAKKTELFNAELDSKGTIKGEWIVASAEYCAYDKRESRKSFNSEDEYLKSIESKFPGISIDSYQCKGLDSINGQMTEKFNISLKNRFTTVGDKMYINPFFFDKYTENPFKPEERLYPIDFVTPIDTRFSLQFKVPEGWQVDELPKNIRLILPDKSASIQYTTVYANGAINLSYRLIVSKPLYIQTEYKDLKVFFSELVKKQSEMITLKKI